MKKAQFFLSFVLISSLIFAFDWPGETDKFSADFGQLRGGKINNSLVFEEPSDIKAADNGEVILFIKDFQDETDFFPSTLGNALVITHDDNLLTIYGNLSEVESSVLEIEDYSVAQGEKIAESGNSSWREGKSSLEFQVIDTKNNTAINPKILMPRSKAENPLIISGVVLQNRNGAFFDGRRNPSMPAGFYRIYKNRQENQTPYKTRLSLNGALMDEISYDVLRQEGRFVCITGKRNYKRNVLYPNDELELLGEASFSSGRNSIQLSAVDFLGKEINQTYVINNY